MKLGGAFVARAVDGTVTFKVMRDACRNHHMSVMDGLDTLNALANAGCATSVERAPPAADPGAAPTQAEVPQPQRKKARRAPAVEWVEWTACHDPITWVRRGGHDSLPSVKLLPLSSWSESTFKGEVEAWGKAEAVTAEEEEGAAAASAI